MRVVIDDPFVESVIGYILPGAACRASCHMAQYPAEPNGVVPAVRLGHIGFHDLDSGVCKSSVVDRNSVVRHLGILDQRRVEAEGARVSENSFDQGGSVEVLGFTLLTAVVADKDPLS